MKYLCNVNNCFFPELGKKKQKKKTRHFSSNDYSGRNQSCKKSIAGDCLKLHFSFAGSQEPTFHVTVVDKGLLGLPFMPRIIHTSSVRRLRLVPQLLWLGATLLAWGPACYCLNWRGGHLWSGEFLTMLLSGQQLTPRGLFREPGYKQAQEVIQASSGTETSSPTTVTAFRQGLITSKASHLSDNWKKASNKANSFVLSLGQKLEHQWHSTDLFSKPKWGRRSLFPKYL